MPIVGADCGLCRRVVSQRRKVGEISQGTVKHVISAAYAGAAEFCVAPSGILPTGGCADPVAGAETTPLLPTFSTRLDAFTVGVRGGRAAG